jgi:hypothetical protein
MATEPDVRFQYSGAGLGCASAEHRNKGVGSSENINPILIASFWGPPSPRTY